MDDVMPFLENVTRGRNVPRQRLLEVAKHYEIYSGNSPINAANRQIIAELEIELTNSGLDLPVYWGNRNWHPFISDTVKKMQADGKKQILAFATSAFSSYSSCRQYLEDIDKASAELGSTAPVIQKIRPFFNHPLFVEANRENLEETWNKAQEENQTDTILFFTAHSLPLSMANNCAYRDQLEDLAQYLSACLKITNWQLVYQSRSGPPHVPWLEPDILEAIKHAGKQGIKKLVIHPLGFVSDHMEVVYDLDHEAKNLCAELGIKMYRVPCPGTHPKFIKMIKELIIERVDPNKERPFLGKLGACRDCCPQECCLPDKSGPAQRPALTDEKKEVSRQ